MNQEILFSLLRKLAPSGEDGFEGLIAKLLENLTGRKFFLAKPGFQGGRDMSTGGLGANNIAVECKRFHANTELNDREILGELTQACQNFPGLDLWILVASGVDISKLSVKTKRVNITMPAMLLNTVDMHAKKHGETRSGLLAQAVTEYIKSHQI